MTTHAEHDLLSAFLDGALSDADRARVEAHLRACAECSDVLRALEATLADLRRLDDPEMPAQVSHAIAAAVTRARARPGRATRMAIAMSGAAAVLIAVAVVARMPEGRGPVGAGQDAAAPAMAGGSAYDARSASARLTEMADMFSPDAGAGAPSPQSKEALRSFSYEMSDSAWSSSADMDRCERESVRTRGAPEVTPVSREAGSYEGTPAFLLVYAVPAADPDRLEMWIVARDDCRVLFFAQERFS